SWEPGEDARPNCLRPGACHCHIGKPRIGGRNVRLCEWLPRVPLSIKVQLQSGTADDLVTDGISPEARQRQQRILVRPFAGVRGEAEKRPIGTRERLAEEALGP